MGGEVEGDGDALLARGEVPPIEGVRIFGGGEAGILPDRPGPLHIHGGVGAAQIRRQARQAVEEEEVEAGDVLRPVSRLHGDAFGRLPGGSCRRGDGARPVPAVEITLGEGGYARHRRSDLVISGAEDSKGITALLKEGANAGTLPGLAIAARLAREVDALGSGGQQSFRRAFRLSRVDLVGGAEAGKLRA